MSKGFVTTVVDLSHFIEEGMPAYPGTEPPRIKEANTLEADGFREKLLTVYSHTGTHADAPAHILSGAPTLDELPTDRFLGSAVVLDVSGLRGGDGPSDSAPQDLIGTEHLEPAADELEEADYLLIRTGWDRFWGSDAYYSGFPVLDENAAGFITRMGLKGLGVDCISVDPAGSGDLPIHRILLGAGLVIIENLTNLGVLPQGTVRFSCLPLKIRDADGSPVRAVAAY